MDLYLFPECISSVNGYGIGVEYAYNKLCPRQEDIVVWYSKEKVIPRLKKNDIIIDKSAITFKKRLQNVLVGKPSTELNINDLNFLKGMKFDKIHCDEILFFKALRKLYPNQHIDVRFHNCYARIYDRYKMINMHIDWKFKLILHLCRNTERYIMNDKNSTKIFISNEDYNYYVSTFGRKSDALVWGYAPDLKLMEINRKPLHLSKKIVWFGGLDAHKESSISWFITKVYIYLKMKNPEIEFHLWGRGTEKYNDKSKSIYGHGFMYNDGFPLENAIYVNPDILGGGIKLKLLSYMNAGIPFVSSPFGFEGYSKELIDNKYCSVAEDGVWGAIIEDLFNKYK